MFGAFGYEYAWWVLPILIWEVVWKAIAMWKSARNNHLVWFILVLVINSFGILPIIYLMFFQKKKSSKEVKPSIKKKRK